MSGKGVEGGRGSLGDCRKVSCWVSAVFDGKWGDGVPVKRFVSLSRGQPRSAGRAGVARDKRAIPV